MFDVLVNFPAIYPVDSALLLIRVLLPSMPSVNIVSLLLLTNNDVADTNDGLREFCNDGIRFFGGLSPGRRRRDGIFVNEGREPLLDSEGGSSRATTADKEEGGSGIDVLDGIAVVDGSDAAASSTSFESVQRSRPADTDDEFGTANGVANEGGTIVDRLDVSSVVCVGSNRPNTADIDGVSSSIDEVSVGIILLYGYFVVGWSESTISIR